jgi:plastocyanin
LDRVKFLFSLMVFLSGALLVVGWSQSPPVLAPVVDRIGFPYGYQNNYKLFYTFDQFQNRQIRVVHGNDVAAGVKSGEPYPYGSILVGEFYPALRGADGEPVLDANGRFVIGGAPTVFVMRKERNFGIAYGPNRGGEWEYVAYRPDGTYATPPQNTASCSICHQLAGPDRDFVFRTNLLHSKGSGALADGVIKNYRFLPGTLRVTAGTTVTIYNADEADFHTITADNGAFDSERVDLGGSFSVTLTQPGRYDFHCNRHPRMRGTIIVDPAGN